MKILIKILCILLVLCFIGTAFIGCGKKKGGDESLTESPSQENTDDIPFVNEYGEASFTSSLPVGELDFEGEDVVILLRDNIQNTREWTKKAIEDELDEAIAMRNAAVQDSLNVNLVFELISGSTLTEYYNKMTQMIITDVSSGKHYYDINCATLCFVARSEIRDYATNLLDKSEFPYFNFTLPCWNQAIVKNTTINNKLFYVAGDINLSMFDSSMIIWHNKTLYDRKKEATDPDNMQQLALDGNWTYDVLYEWATRLQEDSNGTPGMQSDDTYGFCTFPNNPCPADALPYAWDLEFVVENNDGSHKFNILGNIKAETALSNFRKLLNASGTTATDASTSNAVKNFAAGKYVFFTDRLYYSYDDNMAIREMDDKYGLLPLPKYDANQTNYGTTSQDYFNVFSVIDHSQSLKPIKGEAVSAVLELATEESYTAVRGYYFNRIIKPKFFGTDDSEGTVTKSIALFDIIIANIEFDYQYIYAPQLANVHHLWRNACYEDTTLEKKFSGAQVSFEQAMEATDKWLGLR